MFKYVSVIEKVICLIYIIFKINSCNVVAVFTPAITTCRYTKQTVFFYMNKYLFRMYFLMSVCTCSEEIQQVLWSSFFICSNWYQSTFSTFHPQSVGTRTDKHSVFHCATCRWTLKLWKYAARSVGGNDCGSMVFVAPADISKNRTCRSLPRVSDSLPL